MGRLVDIDKVLAVPMSKRAREKIEAIPTKPAIFYDSECSWHSDTALCEKHTLACIMLMAFRYGVNRHGTQALFRPDAYCVIEQNFGLMQDDFIRQMIDDILHEYEMWEITTGKIRKEYFLDSPYYLQPFLDKLQEEWKRRGYVGDEIKGGNNEQ